MWIKMCYNCSRYYYIKYYILYIDKFLRKDKIKSELSGRDKGPLEHG